MSPGFVPANSSAWYSSIFDWGNGLELQPTRIRATVTSRICNAIFIIFPFSRFFGAAIHWQGVCYLAEPTSNYCVYYSTVSA